MSHLSEVVLVRVYGNNTEVFIDRAQELKTIALLASLSIAPQVHSRFINGFVYGFAKGTPFTLVEMQTKSHLVAKKLAEFHSIDAQDLLESRFENTIKKWMNHIPLQYKREQDQNLFKTHINLQTLREKVSTIDFSD